MHILMVVHQIIGVIDIKLLQKKELNNFCTLNNSDITSISVKFMQNIFNSIDMPLSVLMLCYIYIMHQYS